MGIPQVTSLKLNTLKTLFDNYEYKNIQEHKVLKEALSKYHVALKANKEISIFISPKTYSTPIVNKEPETINFINIFLQLQGMITAIHCSIMNNHVEVAEKLFIDILSKANIDLNLIYSQYEFQIHKAYTNTLFELVNQFISMEYGDKIIKDFTPHIKHYYNITYTLSTMLINNNHLDEAKELLTAALSNITIDDQVNAKDIGWCQYNLGVVYYKTGQLELAIKYYNSAIDRLPEEEEIIYNLWTIYEGAIKNYDLAIQYQSDYAENYLAKRIALLRLENKKEAKENFNLALKYRPNIIEEYEKIIKGLRKLGNSRMADYLEEKLQILKNNL